MGEHYWYKGGEGKLILGLISHPRPRNPGAAWLVSPVYFLQSLVCTQHTQI